MMAKRTEALQNVSEAIHLDGNGCHQGAYAKYLQSLQALSTYLYDQFNLQGFPQKFEDQRETKKVLSVVSECVNRMNSILCNTELQKQPNFAVNRHIKMSEINAKENSQDISHVEQKSCYSPQSNCPNFSADSSLVVTATRLSPLEQMQKENSRLFRVFHSRLENSKDNYTRANLHLELQRRLTENFAVAKKKEAEYLKQQQNEKKQILELAAKRLFNVGEFANVEDRELQSIYAEILKYECNQIRPVELQLHLSSLSLSKQIELLLKDVLRTSDHPLSKWIILIQGRVKNKIESILQEYSHFLNILPGQFSRHKNNHMPSGRIVSEKLTDLEKFDSENIVEKPIEGMHGLQQKLNSIADDIKTSLENIIQVLYLICEGQQLKSTDAVIYKIAETSFLQPVWPSLFTLFRLSNLSSECQIAQTIMHHMKDDPEHFGVSSSQSSDLVLYKEACIQLRRLTSLSSLVDKLQILVQVSQQLCSERKNTEEYDCPDSEKLLGADDLIPNLCYVLVQTGLPHLISECCALEQLVDKKYLLGEEGYSLASFQTALKYLEMKKLMDSDANEPGQDKKKKLIFI